MGGRARPERPPEELLEVGIDSTGRDTTFAVVSFAGVAATPRKTVFEAKARTDFPAGMRVAGGTDEIMRNIVGERVLGLPKDAGIDSKSPFNELKK